MTNLFAETDIKLAEFPYLGDQCQLMQQVEPNGSIVGADDPILITGASGFVGTRVVENLLARGFRNLRCFVRPSSPAKWLDELSSRGHGAAIQVFKGNLLSREDCLAATKDVAVIYHLAAGRGEAT